MRRTKWDANQLKNFLETMLDSWDLLSNQQATIDDVTSRQGRADDNKWQIVITDKVTSLVTDGKKKVMKVPLDFQRGLLQTNPSGALPVSAHELSHVLQTEAADVLTETIPLAGIKGRRYITGSEMGGVLEERILLSYLDLVRPTNDFYLKGLKVKEAGGSIAEVVRAVHGAKGGTFDDSEDRRVKSVNQALRLYRNGGVNSQPLDYLEQERIVESLGEQPVDKIRLIATQAVSFALMDSAKLHQVDMLNLDNLSSHRRPAEEVLAMYLLRFHTA